MPTFSFSSTPSVPAEEFLTTLTMAGVNAELHPLVRMTAPESFSARSILDWPQQQRLFQSWILLLGLIPIDRHTFFFEVIDAQRGFSERSTSWTNAFWSHERKVVAVGPGCRVTDLVGFKSRVPLVDIFLNPIYQLVFRQRHKNLRRRFSASAR